MGFETLEGPNGEPVTAKGNADGAQLVELAGGAGTPAAPSVVVGTPDGVAEERLATRADQVTTEAKIDELTSQGRSANEITLANIALTTSPAQLPSIVLRHGVPVSVQNPDGSGQTVYVGRSNAITPALAVPPASPTWQIAEGTAEYFGGQNANEWYACATAACTIAIRVEGRSS